MKFFLLFIIMFSSLFAQKMTEKVSIQLDWKYQFEFAGFIAAKEKGFYGDAGLDVELREYQNGTDIVSDVLTHKATYGVYNSSIVVDHGTLKPIVLMATYFQHSPLIFVAKKGIKNPADMVGKRIMGTEDELKYSSLALLLSHFNITSKNAHIIKHSFNVQDFIDGKVDVMSAFRSNQLYELDRAGIQYEIIDPSEYGFIMSAVNLFTSPTEALEHTDRTQRLIDATNRGWEYALDHPDEMIDILQHQYSVQKSRNALRYEAKVTKKLMMTDFYPIGAANGELTVRAFKQLIQTGILSEDQKLGRYLFSDIIASGKNSLALSMTEQKYLLEKKKITICIDPDWYPIEAIRNGKHIGVTADIIANFETKLGIPIEYIPTQSWQQSMEYTKAGKCDILSSVSPSAQRQKYFTFTSPYASLPMVMVTTFDKPYSENISALTGKKLGVVKGYLIEDELRTNYPELEIVSVASITEGLQRVESGELYGYIDNLMVISSYIQKEYTGSLKVSMRLDLKDELSFAVRNNEPILHGIVQKLVISLDDITMQKIYNHWVSTIEEVPWIDTVVIIKILTVFLLVLIGLMWRYIVLKRYNEQLMSLSITDKLTGLYNRQKTDVILTQEQKKVNRYSEYHCALMMIDVDNFKLINDTAGHQAGDDVLKTLADIMKKNLRDTDILGRWGGEEFIAILPHTTLDEAMVVAESLRRKIEEFTFGLGRPVTVSIGVGEFIPEESVHECVGRVDSALYEAKEMGRNKVKRA